jgi:hypothetical protein
MSDSSRSLPSTLQFLCTIPDGEREAKGRRKGKSSVLRQQSRSRKQNEKKW